MVTFYRRDVKVLHGRMVMIRSNHLGDGIRKTKRLDGTTKLDVSEYAELKILEAHEQTLIRPKNLPGVISNAQHQAGRIISSMILAGSIEDPVGWLKSDEFSHTVHRIVAEFPAESEKQEFFRSL